MVSSAMFDWNDEELANILWDEAGESDDHIVPYPDGSENKCPGSYGDPKQRWEKEVACLKPAEQKKPVATTDYHAAKNGCNSQYDTYGGFPATELFSWPDLSLSDSAKADQNSVEQSSKITEVSNNEASRDVEKPLLDEGSELCNQPEEREENDFANYSWANIGSFDDLDRIFSKDDQIFGHGNVAEPCLSSKDVTRSPEEAVPLSVDSPSLGLEALGSKSEKFETNVVHLLDQDIHLLDQDMHLLDQDQAKPGYQKMNDYSCHSPQGVKGSMVNMEYVGCKLQPTLGDKAESEMVGPTSSLNSRTGAIPIDSADKVSGQRKLIKNKKLLGVTSETRKLHNFGDSLISYGPQLEQYDTQYAPLMGQHSSSIIFLQQQFHGHESFQYKHFTNAVLTPEHAFEVQYPSMPASPQFQSGEVKHQQVPTAYDISSCNRNTSFEGPNAPRKFLNMTPKEKIEKLRRRQQMRAILAIQNQHQKFSQPSCNGNCISPRCSHENHMQLMEGGSTEVDESPTLLPSHDPSSLMDQNNSNFVHLNNDDCSIEDTILHQLQDAITKLDNHTRLCIRDSLFRLAQSSMHRQHACDTISANKSSGDEHEVLAEEGTNGHNRFSRMSDVETETNPIDRAVAHLVFHRPLELLGKLPLLESPLPTNLGSERKVTAVMRLPKGVFTESYKDDPSIGIPCLLTEGNESKTPRLDTSENSANNEIADGEAMEVEASQ